MFAAGFGKGFDDISFVSAVRNRVIRVGAGPDAMASDMFGGEHGVFHAGVARELNPGIDVELVGIVSAGGSGAVGKFAEESAHAEMNEHAVAPGFPFAQFREREALGTGFVRRAVR